MPYNSRAYRLEGSGEGMNDAASQGAAQIGRGAGTSAPTTPPHVLSAFPLLKIEDYRY
jgi:hypothetical protein